MSWIKRHKFWFSVLMLFAVGIILEVAGVDSWGFGELVGMYTFFGWIIKMLYSRKKRKEAK